MVEAWGKNQQQVVEQQWLVIQIELQRLVVELYVGNFSDDVLEMALFPGLGRVVHHGDDGVIKLLVFVVQEHQLCPQVGLFRCSQDLQYHKDLPEHHTSTTSPGHVYLVSSRKTTYTTGCEFKGIP